MFVLFSPTGCDSHPAYRQDCWVDVHQSDLGELTCSLVPVVEGEANAPPIGVTRLSLLEQSVGHEFPLFADGRTSTWWISGVVHPGGSWEAIDDSVCVHDPDMMEAIQAFIEGEVIPRSRAMRVWPAVPGRWIHREPLQWINSQHRSRPIAVAAWLAFCLGSGVLLAHTIVRKWWAKAAVERRI